MNRDRAKLYKEGDFLFLVDLKSDDQEKRRKAAHRILDIYIDQLPPINNKIDSILSGDIASRSEPEPEKPKKKKHVAPLSRYDVAGTDDRGELVKMLNNVRTNLSRNKNKPDLLAKWKKKEEAINKKLNG